MSIVSHDVRAALSMAYRQPEWAIFFEVANGTGANKRRSADAVAINMYPSRGLAINGFEIKVDRGDWRRELENPDKAEAIAKYCDFWWVATPKGLIDSKTLPMNWGLIEVEDGKTRIKVQAKQLKPEPVGRGFFAALCRSKSYQDEKVVNALVEQKLRVALADRQQRMDTEVARRTKEASEVLEHHKVFAAAMKRYSALRSLSEDEVIKGMELLVDLGILNGWGPLKSLIASAKSAAKQIADIETKYNLEGKSK